MKYIITESQSNKLNEKLFSFFEDLIGEYNPSIEYFMPDDIVDWIPDEDKRDVTILSVRDNTNKFWKGSVIEFYIPSEEIPNYDNFHKSEVPFITLENEVYDKLTTMFGKGWIEPFKVWASAKYNVNEYGFMPDLKDKSIKNVIRFTEN